MKTVTLKIYLAGLRGIDVNKVKVAGEDLFRDVMNVSIFDLPSFIKHGARLKLNMDKQDIEHIKNFIDNQ